MRWEGVAIGSGGMERTNCRQKAVANTRLSMTICEIEVIVYEGALRSPNRVEPKTKDTDALKPDPYGPQISSGVALEHRSTSDIM